MEVLYGVALLLLVLLPLWALLASPVIAGFVVLGRRLPEPALQSSWLLAAAALVFALLASPVPTPFLTFLVPLGLALVLHDETFVGEVFREGVDPFQARFMVVSFVATAAGAFLAMRYGRGWWSTSSKRARAGGIGLVVVWAAASFAFLFSRLR